MTNEMLMLFISLIAGMVLGFIFFAGLWLTIRKGVTSRYPAVWFIVSLIVRTGITVVGFYFVTDQKWQRMIFCLTGFVLMRLIVTKKAKSARATPPGEEVPHEYKS